MLSSFLFEEFTIAIKWLIPFKAAFSGLKKKKSVVTMTAKHLPLKKTQFSTYIYILMKISAFLNQTF